MEADGMRESSIAGRPPGNPPRIDGRRLRSQRTKHRDVDGDRQTRIAAQVEVRGRACEWWQPLWRSRVHNHGESPELRERLVVLRRRVVERLELSILQASYRRHLLMVLEVLTDVECWARMREHSNLTFGEACAVWRQAIDRLLPMAPATSVSS